MVTPSTRHYALLVLIAAVWGSSFQAMKISVAEIPPLSIAAGRVILGAAVVWPYMHVVRQQTTRGAVGGGVFCGSLVDEAIVDFLLVIFRAGVRARTGFARA